MTAEVKDQELARLRRLCAAQRVALKKLRAVRDRVRTIVINDGRGWTGGPGPCTMLAEIEREVSR